MTKSEMIEVMDIYIKPMYVIIGSTLAVLVIFCAVMIVLWPFIRRL